jgi:hypothetical protein
MDKGCVCLPRLKRAVSRKVTYTDVSDKKRVLQDQAVILMMMKILIRQKFQVGERI